MERDHALLVFLRLASWVCLTLPEYVLELRPWYVFLYSNMSITVIMRALNGERHGAIRRCRRSIPPGYDGVGFRETCNICSSRLEFSPSDPDILQLCGPGGTVMYSFLYYHLLQQERCG